MQQNSSERLARAWIEGWSIGKPEKIPLADGFTHTSPIGVFKGRDYYLEQVKPMAAKNVTTLEIVRILAGDDEAVVWYKKETAQGWFEACDWLKIRDGQIQSITGFYDASYLR